MAFQRIATFAPSNEAQRGYRELLVCARAGNYRRALALLSPSPEVLCCELRLMDELGVLDGFFGPAVGSAPPLVSGAMLAVSAKKRKLKEEDLKVVYRWLMSLQPGWYFEGVMRGLGAASTVNLLIALWENIKSGEGGSILQEALQYFGKLRWETDSDDIKEASKILAQEGVKSWLFRRVAEIKDFARGILHASIELNLPDVAMFVVAERGVDPSVDGNAAIIFASRNGHARLVKLLLLDQRVDPSAIDPSRRQIHDDDYNPIVWASRNGHADAVELLLKHQRVDPSAGDNFAIRVASAYGRARVVGLLLQDERVDPSDENNEAIRFASKHGHAEVVELLLQDERVDPSAENNHAIRDASGEGHAKVVELLLQDERVDPSDEDNEAIRMASRNGHTRVVELLLERQEVDPSAKRNEAIRLSSANGHIEVVRLLMADDGVDPSAWKNQAVRQAAHFGHSNVLELLLSDKRTRPWDNDNQAVRWAAACGHLDVLMGLGKYQVDYSAKDNEAIIFASGNGHYDVVEFLLRKWGVDPAVRSNSAIQEAVWNMHEDLVELLMKHVDPSVPDNEVIKVASKTGLLEIVELLLKDERVNPSGAIQIASKHGHVKVVERLLEDSRADPSDNANKAIRMASKNGHVEIVELLLKDHRVDPSDYENEAICLASENGHVEIVELLLKDRRVDPSDRSCRSLYRASSNGHVEIAKLLLKDERVDPSVYRKTMIEDVYSMAPYQRKNRKKSLSWNRWRIVSLLLQDRRVNSPEHVYELIEAAIGGNNLKMLRMMLRSETVERARITELLNVELLEKVCDHENTGMLEFLLDRGLVPISNALLVDSSPYYTITDESRKLLRLYVE